MPVLAKCLYTFCLQYGFVGTRKKAIVGKLIPVLAGALILLLGFFAFRGGFGGIGATGAVTLKNTSINANFLIEEISINVDNNNLALSSGEKVIIETDGRTINITGNLDLIDFKGTVEWDGEKMITRGSMEELHREGLNIVWKKREKATITLTSGLAEIPTMELPSLDRIANGRITFEGSYSILLNETPISIKGFKGRVYLQRANDYTSLGLEGTAKQVRIDEENLLKKIV